MVDTRNPRFLIHDGRSGTQRTYLNPNGTLTAHKSAAGTWEAEEAFALLQVRPFLRMVQVERLAFAVFGVREHDQAGGFVRRERYSSGLAFLSRPMARYRCEHDAEEAAAELRGLFPDVSFVVRTVDALDAPRHLRTRDANGNVGTYPCP
jgi:hypothetical protein